ncbi:hypothetical protein E1263_17795 [Kribbella antibiotica]|uniref:Uncharacterized protein n=1 Tax=Kribbella antibiotica TaxID=190195 RepID=A0A4R4ZJT3_9ACTN|nr:hypothetical protein [Kribbella antibiotica]TDD58765.1 hypothetical protein E1263_17795 [Kribbella antibiotica]
MNEQELAVRVGELAAATGCPVASGRWEPGGGQPLRLERKSGAAVLVLRPVVAEWCSALQEFMIAQLLVATSLGVRRHFKVFKFGGWIAGAVLGAAGAYYFGAIGIVVAVLALGLVMTAILWAYHRSLTRRVDERLLPILGPVVMRSGLEHLACKLSIGQRILWVLNGAPPRGGQRMRWVGTRTTSVAD